MDTPGTAAAVALDNCGANGCEILVAEDDAVTTLVTRRFLQKAGYRVTTVENGQKALELLGVDPRLAPLQLREVEQAVSDLKDFLRKKGLAK